MNEWQIDWLLEKMQPILECSQLKHLKFALESIPTKETCSTDTLRLKKWCKGLFAKQPSSQECRQTQGQMAAWANLRLAMPIVPLVSLVESVWPARFYALGKILYKQGETHANLRF